jgi:hypothetical protein
MSALLRGKRGYHQDVFERAIQIYKKEMQQSKEVMANVPLLKTNILLEYPGGTCEGGET